MIYYVRAGDTLWKIADLFGISTQSILNTNRIQNPNVIYVGQRITIENPKKNPYSIEINTSQRILKLLINKQVIKEYSVAVGKPSTPTPKGSWIITQKALWGEQFGGYFMRLSIPTGIYGIHGTNKPWSIGTAASNGCIRMHSNQAGELYSMIAIGTPVLIY